MVSTRQLSDLVDINPAVPVVKGRVYPFVAMEDIVPGRRYVTASQRRPFSGGGARFQAGDTLFARITPCLENGKIAQFVDPMDQVGFGSTEFFVLRPKEGVADPGFIFYLSCTDIVRKPAEKSMKGASGRQRADVESIKDLEVPAPPLPIQRKIAAILSAYDDLIENNTRRIQILEEMARAIYREWFVNFRFPGHENVKMVSSELGPIPEGWEVKPLGEVCNIVMGQSPKSEYYNQIGDGLPFHQGVTDFGTHFPHDRVYCTLRNRVAEKGDILFSVRAPVGRINVANKRIVIGRGLCAIRSRDDMQTFILYQLKEKFKEEDTIGGGTIFQAVTKNDMLSIKTLVPPVKVVKQFEALAKLILSEIEILTLTNANLRQPRDLLLPKLISGELDVSELDIKTEGMQP